MRWHKLSSELYNAGAVVRPRKTLDVLRGVSSSAAEPTYSAMIIRRPTSWTESRRDLPRKLTLESSWSRSPTQSHPDAVLGGNPIGELARTPPSALHRAAISSGRTCANVASRRGDRRASLSAPRVRAAGSAKSSRAGHRPRRIVTRDLSGGGVVADVPRDPPGLPVPDPAR